VDVCSEELGLENSAPGDIDCDKALPWESCGGEICGVIALASVGPLRMVPASLLLSLVRDSRGVSGGDWRDV
jgi:hypothetical protein